MVNYNLLLQKLKIYNVHKDAIAWFTSYLRAVPEIILGGHRHFFVRWREVVLLTMCPRGGGVEG